MPPLMRLARLHEPGQPMRIDSVPRPTPRVAPATSATAKSITAIICECQRTGWTDSVQQIGRKAGHGKRCNQTARHPDRS